MWSMTRIPTGALVGFEAEAWLPEGGGEAGRGVGWFLGASPITAPEGLVFGRLHFQAGFSDYQSVDGWAISIQPLTDMLRPQRRLPRTGKEWRAS